MSLLSLIGGLTVITVAFLWARVRLTLYSLQADTDVPVASVDKVYNTAVFVMVAYTFLDGIVFWLTSVWNLLL